MHSKEETIRQNVTAMSRSELELILNTPLSELRPIDLERVLESLKTFHWDTGTAPTYEDQPLISDLRDAFSDG